MKNYFTISKLLNFGIWVFIIFSPVSIAGVQTGWLIALLFWFIAIFTGKLKPQKTEADRWIYALMVITVFSAMVASLRINGFNIPGIRAILSGFFTREQNITFSVRLFQKLSLFSVYFIFNSSLKTEQYLSLLKTFFAVTVIFSAYALCQYFDFIPRALQYVKEEERLGGTMGFYMTYGNYYSVAALLFIPYAMKQPLKTSVRYGICFIPLVLSVVFTLTRGAWIGFAAGLGSIIFILNKKLFAWAAAAGILAFFSMLIFLPEISVSRRIKGTFKKDAYLQGFREARPDLWKTAVNMVRRNPILGVGYDNYKPFALDEKKGYRPPDAIPPEGAANYCHAHNNFLQVAAERGLPAFLIFYWIYFIFIRTAYLNYRDIQDPFIKYLSLGMFGGLVSFIFGGLTEYNSGDSEVLMLVLMLAGITMRIWLQHSSQSRRET